MNQTERGDRRCSLLEACFACFCAYGISGTNAKMLAEACGISAGNLYTYFDSKEQIIIESTAYCMAKVEADFMKKAPLSFADLDRFLREVPYWTAREHGSKYRFMYQVYTSPPYLACGKEFFRGVNERYTAYARLLAPKLGLPVDILQGLIFTFVRAAVHFALFEDEEYMLSQMQMLRLALKAFKIE